MATNYAVHIKMSDDTVNKLQDGGYSLYGFKAVQTSLKGGAPLVWFQTQKFSLTTDVKWQSQFQAYTSRSEIKPNVRIDSSASYDADLGQTLQVTGTGGTGVVVQGGTPGAITIANMTQPPTDFTCGISQQRGAGEMSQLCAFPLYGTGTDVMAPVEKVLLMFATQQVDTGTVIYKAYSQGILIDLTGTTEREVSYDITQGWSWSGAAWAQKIQVNADLSPLLLNYNLSKRLVA